MVSQYKQSDTKTKIINAAKKIFSKKGYHKATIDDIAKEAKIAKGTVYFHFTSKEKLFISIIEKEFENTYEMIKEARNYSNDIFEKIKNMIREFWLNTESKRKLFLTLMYEPPLLKKMKIKYIFINKIKSINSLIENVIKEGIKKGNIKNIKPAFITAVLNGMIRGIIFSKIVLKRKSNMEEDIALIIEILKNGIATKEDSR